MKPDLCIRVGGKLPRSLEDIYKKYEFNKTEPETLTGLITSVIKKSEEIKRNFDLYRDLTEFVYEIMVRENLLNTMELSYNENFYTKIFGLGIDGSFQCVGGLGGIWYVPISCSRVLFPDGLKSQPTVDVAAEIHDINAIEYLNLEKEASFRMLIGETKAINDWLASNTLPEESVIFMDGPIVDPPWFSYEKSYLEYVKDRTNVIKKCVKMNALLIGCVKRIIGRYLINYIKNILPSNDDKERVNKFTSDAHLITYVLTRMSSKSPNNIIFTTPINVSSIDATHNAYLKEGVEIHTIFMQKNLSCMPIRLDFPILINNESDVIDIANKIVKITASWTYPGQYSPLPVEMAHYKCNIRKGCAEVLYDEMITRTKSPNVFDNIVNMKLR